MSLGGLYSSRCLGPLIQLGITTCAKISHDSKSQATQPEGARNTSNHNGDSVAVSPRIAYDTKLAKNYWDTRTLKNFFIFLVQDLRFKTYGKNWRNEYICCVWPCPAMWSKIWMSFIQTVILHLRDDKLQTNCQSLYMNNSIHLPLIIIVLMSECSCVIIFYLHSIPTIIYA